MSQTPLKINDLVQIRLSESEPGQSYPSRVDDIAGEKLFLSWPSHAGSPVPINVGRRLVLYFLREDAVYTFEATLEEALQEPIPRLAVRQTGEIQRIQRRAYFRVRASLPVQLTGVVRSGKSRGPDKGDTVHIVTSTVDISGAGMSIHHSTPLPVDTIFETRMAIEDGGTPLKLLSRVVHYEPVVGLERDRRIYHVAFFFVAITEAQRRRIVRRCFKFQQECLAHAGSHHTDDPSDQ